MVGLTAGGATVPGWSVAMVATVFFMAGPKTLSEDMVALVISYSRSDLELEDDLEINLHGATSLDLDDGNSSVDL